MNDARLVDQLKALGHPERLRLVDLLARPELFPDNLVDATDVGVCVNDLASCAGLPQSTASGHITKLRQAGLIEVEQRGQWRYVRPNRDELDSLAVVVTALGATPQLER